jgi:hypothetical protein
VKSEALTIGLTIGKESSPLSIVMLFFTAVIPLLVEETDCYYHQYFDKQDEGPSSPLPDMTSEMFLLFGIDYSNGTFFSRLTERLWVNSGTNLYTFLQ